MPNNGIPVYFASLRYSERKNKKISLRAQQNQEGDTDTVTIYFFLAKYDVEFEKCQTKACRGIYCTLNENKLLRAQQNQEGDTNTVYCHGIPLSGKTCDVVFNFVLVLEYVCFLLVDTQGLYFLVDCASQERGTSMAMSPKQIIARPSVRALYANFAALAKARNLGPIVETVQQQVLFVVQIFL